MLTDEQKMMALHMPHNIMLADQLIDVKVSGFSSSVTLGFMNPGSVIQTAATFSVPTDKLYKIATEILEAINKNKAAILQEQQEFISNL
jgi:hypothetical protein